MAYSGIPVAWCEGKPLNTEACHDRFAASNR